MHQEAPVILARLGRPFGVAGWLSLHSFTEPSARLFDYASWFISGEASSEHWTEVVLEDWRQHASGLVVKIKGCEDRTVAQGYTGRHIAVSRLVLPALSSDCFYWRDLEGLEVRLASGDLVGSISQLLNQGAGDLMQVTQSSDGAEIYIPFVWGDTVKQVDLVSGCVVIDWDLSFNALNEDIADVSAEGDLALG